MSASRATAAALNKASANKERVTELQSRELEKGAHLREETVDEHDVEVPDGRLERLTKDDGETYFRLPESADPLDRGNVSLAYGDLLPIQQLARMHDEMRRAAANTVPTRLAAKLWQARVDDSVGDNPGRTAAERSPSTSRRVISSIGFVGKKPVSARVTRRNWSRG